MKTGQHSRRFNRSLFLVGVFLLLLALGTVEGPRGDAGWRLVLTRQLLVNQSLHLPEEPSEAGLIETPWGWTSYFAIGQTLLFIPFEIVGKAMSLILPGFRDFPTVRLYGPLLGVIYFAAMMALLEAFGLSRRSSALTALLFTFGSVSAYYLAQSYQEEAIAGIFVCLATRAALLWRQSPRARYAFQFALFGGCILLFRLNGVFALIPSVILILQGLYSSGLRSPQLRRSFSAALVGVLGPAITHLLFAYLRFGDPFSTGYDQIYTGTNITIVPSAPVFQMETARILLFGLGKGLFIYSPILFIALWGLWAGRRNLMPYGIGCLVAIAANVALVIRIFPMFADGCWSWGARYQVHLLPLFVYPAWLGMQDLVRRRLKIVVSAVLIFGILFQVVSFLGSDRVEYQQLTTPGGDQACRIVRENQFSMRLANIAIATGLRSGDALTEEVLQREFGTLWVLRRQRNRSVPRRIVVVVTWLATLSGAAFCLYRSLRVEEPLSVQTAKPPNERVTTRL